MQIDSSHIGVLALIALILFILAGATVFLVISLVRLKVNYQNELYENEKLTELLDVEQSQNTRLAEEIRILKEQLEERKKIIDVLKEKGFEESLLHEQKLAVLKQENSQLCNDKESIQKEWELFKETTSEKIQFLQQTETRLIHQFENLSQRMITHSQDTLSQHNHQNLTSLLSPLKAQIDLFNQQLNERLTDESKERFALKYEITQLYGLNQRLAEEALNLTNALKNNNKIQGNWGEMILMNLLESVGFIKGREYTIQSSFENDEKKRLIPDVIVHLPENKQVIIDSKVSLVAFENYYHAKDRQESDAAIKSLINSIRTHMKGLSDKQYQKLKGLNTLEYVLMFVPIEAAFILAVGEADNLLAEAQKLNIMLVSPSTLFVALRTIQQLWRSEYKNQNATQIALKASKLYDKFRLFLEDFQSVGLHIQRVDQSYQNAFNKLSQGKGNLIQHIEGFRTLGVDVKKPIDNILVETSTTLTDELSPDETVTSLPSDTNNVKQSFWDLEDKIF
ncbi:DNA recombination protein RmuC [Thorsellia kenyensis]|uniref:DNA recombination protein RmuC n=1 Tax=Thorsellia kenyensis TaxID=1549888 RepID=A0ABV6CCU2_9GAMM